MDTEWKQMDQNSQKDEKKINDKKMKRNFEFF